MSNLMTLERAKKSETCIVDMIANAKTEVDHVLAAVKMVWNMGHEGLHAGQPEPPDIDTILAFMRLLDAHLESASETLQEVLDCETTEATEPTARQSKNKKPMARVV